MALNIAQLRHIHGPMRLISFALTVEQARARIKTETRRSGWLGEKPGRKLIAASKVMGFRKGESIDDVAEIFGVIELVEVRREPLNAITQDGVIAEGFPHWTPLDFVKFYLDIRPSMLPSDPVTVLRFRWLEG
jgi:hypothetical protein